MGSLRGFKMESNNANAKIRMNTNKTDYLYMLLKK